MTEVNSMVMITLTIISLALIDSINPPEIAIAIAILLYKGIGEVWGFIHGIFLTIFAQLLFLYFGLGKLLDLISKNNLFNPSWTLILLGIGITTYGYYLWQHRYQIPKIKKSSSLSVFNYTSYLKFFCLGSATILAESPGAFLLIFAVIEVKKIPVNLMFVLFYLMLYALIYTLPIIALNFAAIWQERRLKIWLSRRKNWIYIRLNILLSLSLLALGVFCLALGLGQL
ncbi:GAP family protein [Microcystis aeruginosa]|jgi:cytochrome c biogenesis protein CcdA|uniref:GAP family protein n=3 Tax=Microcystis aeruginosa TaxID=1126 RepID=UPI001D14F459|nr:GAP family protein [Microcystis aeruginosa]